MDWRTYFSTTETKLRSFIIRTNFLSVITNVQLAGFGIIDVNCVHFVWNSLKRSIIFFKKHRRKILER